MTQEVNYNEIINCAETNDKNAEHYLLHREPMLLIDQLLTYSESAVTVKTVIDEKYRLFMDDTGKIPAWISIELMAQAVGIWAGFHSKKRGHIHPKLGFLLGGRQCKHFTEFYQRGDVLLIHATILIQDERMASFDAQINKIDGTILSSARLTTYQPNEAELSDLL